MDVHTTICIDESLNHRQDNMSILHFSRYMSIDRTISQTNLQLKCGITYMINVKMCCENCED